MLQMDSGSAVACRVQIGCAARQDVVKRMNRKRVQQPAQRRPTNGGKELPHCKTLRDLEAPTNIRQVLECASPSGSPARQNAAKARRGMALWLRAFARQRVRHFEN